MSTRFEMNFGGIGRFPWSRSGNIISQCYFVSQKGYADGLSERFNTEESKASVAPMEAIKGCEEVPQLVASLIYLAIKRPKIPY